jgi:TRAP-type uncharacterized transport system substrate-binding protein
MSAQAQLSRIFWRWVAPLAGLGGLALALFFYFHSPRVPTYRLRMTAGNKLGMRHRLAELLREELSRQGLELVLHETPGSEEALDEVNDRRLDVALVQGGLRADGRPNVRQVLPLHMEALHLLVKQELSEQAGKHLAALEGKTVSLSEVGSGTHSLATEVLGFAGLRARGTGFPRGYVPVEMSRQQLLAEKDRARLPDAVMLVSLVPSPTARYMVTRHGYRLVPLPFGEAFALQALAPDSGGPSSSHLIDKAHTYPASIPAFACSVEPPVPAEAVPTIGTRLLLVAHEDVAPQAVRRLVEATLASKAARHGRPPLDGHVLALPPEFPWHEGTVLYRRRNQPVVSGTLVDSAQKAFAIFAAAASGLFVLWQWSKQSAHLRRDRGFNSYLHQVTRIEEQALEVERGGPASREQLLALREQLGRVKTEALDRFTAGDLTGKELLAGFLAHANSARDLLTRLLAQEVRDRAVSSPPPRG